jgi:hypothetical protein
VESLLLSNNYNPNGIENKNRTNQNTRRSAFPSFLPFFPSFLLAFPSILLGIG